VAGILFVRFLTPNVELSGPCRHGAWAAERMMVLDAARPKCHAGAGPRLSAGLGVAVGREREGAQCETDGERADRSADRGPAAARREVLAKGQNSTQRPARSKARTRAGVQAEGLALK
jgi:hypothetical protein